MGGGGQGFCWGLFTFNPSVLITDVDKVVANLIDVARKMMKTNKS